MRLIACVALALVMTPRVASAVDTCGYGSCSEAYCTGETAAVIDATVLAADDYDQPNRRVTLEVHEVVPADAVPLGEVEVGADVYSVGPGFVGTRTVLFAREEAGALILTTALIDYDIDRCFSGQRALGSIAAVVQSDTCATQVDDMETAPTNKLLMCCSCSTDADPVGGLLPIALLLGLRRAAAGLLRPRRAASSGGGSRGPSGDRERPCCDPPGPSD